jgi:hypothetical protein
MTNVDIENFITLAKASPNLVGITAVEVPDNIINEINSHESWSVLLWEEKNNVTSVDVSRGITLTKDNSVLFDCSIQFEDHDPVDIAYVIHLDDLAEAGNMFPQGLEHLKNYFQKSELTRWMLRNRGQPVLYRAHQGNTVQPLVFVAASYGETRPLQALLTLISNVDQVIKANVGGHDELSQAQSITNDSEAAMICVTAQIADRTEVIQFPLTKEVYNNTSTHQTHVDYVTDLINKLNEVAQK